MDKAFTAVILSVALHFLLLELIERFPAPPPPKKPPLEVSILEKPKGPEPLSKINKQVVTQTLVPEKMQVKESKDDLKFLGDKLQRVKEQTRAALSGLTENRSNSVNQSKQAQVKSNPLKSMKDFSPHEDDLEPQPNDENGPTVAHQQKNPQTTASEDTSVPGLSTIAESMDVKVGTMTALNTDQYLFYSFFHRVNQLVYVRWVHKIEDSEPMVANRLKGKSTNDHWTTEVDIWIRPNGVFDSAHIMRESGVLEFDQAATQSFQQAGLFANAPPELVEEDGFIHLKYNLTVYFDVRDYFFSLKSADKSSQTVKTATNGLSISHGGET